MFLAPRASHTNDLTNSPVLLQLLLPRLCYPQVLGMPLQCTVLCRSATNCMEREKAEDRDDAKEQQRSCSLSTPSASNTILFHMRSVDCTPACAHAAAVSSTAARAEPGLLKPCSQSASHRVSFSATTHDELSPHITQILRVNCKLQRQLTTPACGLVLQIYQISFVGARSSHIQQLRRRSSVEGTAPRPSQPWEQIHGCTEGTGSGWHSCHGRLPSLCCPSDTTAASLLPAADSLSNFPFSTFR